MATETTQDAVIVVPPKESDKIQVTETEAGTKVEFTAPTSKAEVVVTGNVVATGSTISKSTFTFTEEGALAFEAGIKGSQINATVGNDSVAFANTVKDTKTSLGLGSDSVAFGGASKVNNAKVSLGVGDGSVDTVNIDKLKSVKKLKLTNFGSEDKLIVNGKTFTADDLQNKDFGGKITIKFD